MAETPHRGQGGADARRSLQELWHRAAAWSGVKQNPPREFPKLSTVDPALKFIPHF